MVCRACRIARPAASLPGWKADTRIGTSLPVPDHQLAAAGQGARSAPEGPRLLFDLQVLEERNDDRHRGVALDVRLDHEVVLAEVERHPNSVVDQDLFAVLIHLQALGDVLLRSRLLDDA